VPTNSHIYRPLLAALHEYGGKLPEGIIKGLETVSEPFRNQEQEQEQEISLSEPKTCSDQEGTSKSNPTQSESFREATRLANLLAAEILNNKPDYRITPSALRNWTVTADRMIRIDERDPEKIADLIRWVQQDEFWMSNVLSMDTLREKFDQLAMKRELDVKHKKPSPVNGKSPIPADYVSPSEQALHHMTSRQGAR